MHKVFFTNLVTLQATAQSAQQGQKLNPWELALNASPVVMAVLITLIVMSVICWFIIGAKLVRLQQATRESADFLDEFWNPELGNRWTTERIEEIYGILHRMRRSPVANVFRAGYVELARVLGSIQSSSGKNGHYTGDIDNVARALSRAIKSESTNLQNMVPFLATTGSTAPFVGLFGTVWGIMNSFINIGSQRNASLDVVAPGIAEALIATAIGLVAAIPAVMAYNYFIRRISVLEGEMESFSNDYLNIVRRHFLTR
ncbi:MAG: protein TolQ [Deltaproteobacteria bacterium]|nr:protein TolQ [Deltaproteobacteria bacterium]